MVTATGPMRGRRLRRRRRPGRADGGPAALPGRPVGRRPRGTRPGRGPGLDPDLGWRGAGRHGWLLRRPRPRAHARAGQGDGVTTFPTFVEGDNVLATGGKVRRYRGDIPRISPVALLSAGQAIARMNAMAKKVPVDAPWEAPRPPRGTRTRCGRGSAGRSVPDQAGPRPRRGDGTGLLRRRPLRGLAAQLALPRPLRRRHRVADEHRGRLPGLPVRGRRRADPRRHGGRAR